MKLVRIITDRVTGEGLYAIRFTAGQPDEFERLFDLRDQTDFAYLEI